MPKSQKERRADAMAYQATHYHRIALDVRNEDLEAYRQAAAADGQAFSTWIRGLMQQRCDDLGIQVPSVERKNA